MNKYEFMTVLLFAFAALAVALAFSPALRDDGRSRRIYTRHDRWSAPEPLEYRVERELEPGRRALPSATVIDATAVRTGSQPRQVTSGRKELER